LQEVVSILALDRRNESTTWHLDENILLKPKADSAILVVKQIRISKHRLVYKWLAALYWLGKEKLRTDFLVMQLVA
jgi:hypothetical protein